MAKRRKKRFGLGPEAHTKDAERATREAVQFARKAFTQARDGRCSYALDNLSNADSSLGEARAHMHSAANVGLSKKYNKAGTIKVKAGSAFRRFCMKRSPLHT